MKARAALLLMLLLLGCLGRQAEWEEPDNPAEDAIPTNAEVLIYLEGKTLPLEIAGGRPLKINLDGIEAFSVRRNRTRSASGHWLTAINFIYNNGRARYTVEACLEHQRIDEQRVFYDLRFTSITRR